jgi:hypothetical protein
LVNIAEIAMIGTTGAAPTIGHQDERHQRAGAIARDAAGDSGDRRQRGDQYKFCKRDVREKQSGFSR